MNAYLELFRLENGIIGIIGLVVTSFIAAGTDIVNYWQCIILGCATVALFIAGGNSLNDCIDKEIDKVSHPNRPLPLEKIAVKNALYLSITCLILSFILSIAQNPQSTSIVGIAIILMIMYEIILKQRGFVGNITIAILTGMVFLLGGSIVDHVENSVEIAGMAILVTIGREITKDIEDMNGDAGRRTLPMSIGVKNASVVAAVFYIAGPVLSIMPMIEGCSGLYLCIFFADAMFIYAAFIIFNDSHKSQKMAKYAMVVSLIVFALGAINL